MALVVKILLLLQLNLLLLWQGDGGVAGLLLLVLNLLLAHCKVLVQQT
jgi:hypothetical protein